jgi:hypothetical protein
MEFMPDTFLRSIVLQEQQLAESSFYKVEVPRIIDNYHAIDMITWVNEHCQGKTEYLSRIFYFELESDAVWFSLRWL